MALDPFTAHLYAQADPVERRRAQLDVEFYQRQAAASRPWRDIAVIAGVVAVCSVGLYFTALKPKTESTP